MANAEFFNKVTYENIKQAYNRCNYVFFTQGDYNLNIFGIRNDLNRDSNNFNDVLGIVYKVNGNWVVKKYDATTDPGSKVRLAPVSTSGTAILVPNQYRSSWKIGLHKGKYNALVQAKPVSVYRDKNKDSKLDMNPSTIETGMFGINIHRATSNANYPSKLVDSWSAGCQVVSSYNDFQEFMSIVNKASKLYGPKFTYTLFTSSQFLG